MNKFEFNQSVKKSSLSSSEKLILIEILSFIENDKAFYATNKHIASIFNFSESYVKKIISKFQNLGIIESSVDKKKHQSGDQTWYNKRYITINFETLSSFLQMDGSIELVKPIISDLEPSIQANKSISVPIEIMSEIEDNEADEFEYDDEAQASWFNSFLNENSIEVISELEENVIQESEVMVLEEVVVEQSIESNKIKTTIKPSTEVVEPSSSIPNEKKEKFKAEFNDSFKYNIGTMLVPDFHRLTKNYFINLDFNIIYDSIKEITINDYDKFWDNLQELKINK